MPALNSAYFENLVDEMLLNYSNHPISVYKFVSQAASLYQQGERSYDPAIEVIGHYVRGGDEDQISPVGKPNMDDAFVTFSLPELRRKFPDADEFEWISTNDLIEYFGTKYSISCVEYMGFMYRGPKVLKLGLKEYPDSITIVGP